MKTVPLYTKKHRRRKKEKTLSKACSFLSFPFQKRKLLSTLNTKHKYNQTKLNKTLDIRIGITCHVVCCLCCCGSFWFWSLFGFIPSVLCWYTFISVPYCLSLSYIQRNIQKDYSCCYHSYMATAIPNMFFFFFSKTIWLRALFKGFRLFGISFPLRSPSRSNPYFLRSLHSYNIYSQQCQCDDDLMAWIIMSCRRLIRIESYANSSMMD